MDLVLLKQRNGAGKFAVVVRFADGLRAIVRVIAGEVGHHPGSRLAENGRGGMSERTDTEDQDGGPAQAGSAGPTGFLGMRRSAHQVAAETITVLDLTARD